MKTIWLALLLLASSLCFAQGPLGPTSLTSTNCTQLDASKSGLISISVTGTWSGAIQASVGVSGDASTSVSVIPANSATSQATITTNGLYYASTYGASFFRLCGATITNTAVINTFQSAQAITSFVPDSSGAVPVLDPCLNPSVAKNSTFKDITTATTTSLVALSGTTSIYVCGFLVTLTGSTTADTILFEYGTGATCGTGTTILSPTFNSGILTSGATVVSYENGSGSTFKPIPAGNGFCAVTTVGTAPTINVLITYIQQ